MMLRVDSVLTMGFIIAFLPMSVHYSRIRHLGYERLYYIPQGKKKTDRVRKAEGRLTHSRQMGS